MVGRDYQVRVCACTEDEFQLVDLILCFRLTTGNAAVAKGDCKISGGAVISLSFVTACDGQII